MAPRLQPTSRKHTNEGNADFAVEHQAPVTISTEQISPANQQHKSYDFFTREQRWRTAFESSAIGITMADLDGHYLAANTVFQNMVGYTEAELREFSFFDITYEEDREAKFKLVRELVERNEVYRAPRSWTERNYHKLIYFHEVDKGGHLAAWEQPGLFSNEIRAAFRSLNGEWEYGHTLCARISTPRAATSISIGQERDNERKFERAPSNPRKRSAIQRRTAVERT